MNDDEEHDAQHGHRAIIQDSWERAREYIRRAEAANVDPSRALWPVGQETVSQQHALAAHTATIQFRDDIMAFRNERTKNDIGELWSKPISTISVADDEYDLSLESLGEWTNQHMTERTTNTDPVAGESVRETEFRVLVPVSACRDCYRHIQTVLHELGLTADTADITPEDEASPEHLWGLLDERSQQEAKGQLPERFTPGRSND